MPNCQVYTVMILTQRTAFISILGSVIIFNLWASGPFEVGGGQGQQKVFIENQSIHLGETKKNQTDIKEI